MSDHNLRVLLDTASTLNTRLSIRNTQELQSKSLLKKESIEGKQVILQDIKDAIETYNREFIEREKDINSSTTQPLNTLQDYSLVILFSGFALFVVMGLAYILTKSKAPIILSIIYLILISLVYVFMVFIIQRYG